MPTLFESTVINGLTLPNRFVRSATWEGLGDEQGSPTPTLNDLLVQLARGGVGLIITGYSYVSPEGQAGPRQLGICTDEQIAPFRTMTEAVHQAGGKIVMQLAHGGCHADYLSPDLESLGPSDMQGGKGESCRSMTLDDIRRVVEAFGQAAARARKAGFDGLQIHAAHGYLLSQFLSPFYNKRTDAYGGSLANRARIVLEVYRSMREAVGDSFPVLIKINAQDFLDAGFTADEMIEVAVMLERAGIDAIELSGGTRYSGHCSPIRRGVAESEAEEAYYREEAMRFKERLRVPLMLVGGIRSYEVARELVEEGLADYIALSRPLIREPQLINRWKSGDTRKAACLSDNLCFRPALKGQGLYCVVEEKLKERSQ